MSLRSTAGQRNFGEAVNTGIRPGVWSIQQWAEIADVFGRHLKYMPGGGDQQAFAPRQQPKESEGEEKEITASDIFTGTYNLVGLTSSLSNRDEASKVSSLQHLILRWFGLETITADLGDDDGSESHDEDEPHGDEEAVDRIEPIPSAQPTVKAPMKKHEVSDRDRRKAHRLLEALSNALTHEDFLRHRPPALLAGDLKISSAILRSALREGWIEADAFTSQSLRIWKALFFTSEEVENQGWLEWRHQSDDDPKSFSEALSGPELAAALLGWFLAIDDTTESGQGAQIELAAALAVGRLPWLWSGDPDEVSQELALLLALTSRSDQLAPAVIEAVEHRCQQLMRNGQALKEVADILDTMTLPDIRKLISQPDVKEGELLWQGRLGFCLALTSSPRDDRHNVAVKYLQASAGQSQIKGSYTVPVRALLNESLVKTEDRALFVDLAKNLQEFVDQIARGHSTWR